MTAEPESLLDRLRRLDKEAKRGPWRQQDLNPRYVLSADLTGVADGIRRTQEAELIVTLRNALPEIIEAFDLLRETLRCFDEDGLLPLGDDTGDRYYRVSEAGQKSYVSAIATVKLQGLHSAVVALLAKVSR